MSQCVVDGCEREAYREGDKCIFHCEKIDSCWDDVGSEQTKEFWAEFDKKIESIGSALPNDGLASNAVMEGFLTNLKFPIWQARLLGWMEALNYFSFTDCEFNIVDFNSSSLKKGLQFSNCIFRKKLHFNALCFGGEFVVDKCRFLEDVLVKHCRFEEEFFIGNNSCFRKRIEFYSNTFLKKVEMRDHVAVHAVAEIDSREVDFRVEKNSVIFDNNKFLNRVSFTYVTFTENVAFSSNEFHDTVRFDISHFGSEGSISYYDCKFSTLEIFCGEKTKTITLNACHFQENSFVVIKKYPEDGAGLKELEISNSKIESKRFVLDDLKITNKFTLTNTVLKNLEFNNVDLIQAKFIFSNVSFLDAYFTKIHWGEVLQERFFKTEIEAPLDREIARQIKYTYDQQGDHIVANKFYSLEMALYRDELRKNGSWQDRLIFGLHGMVSNHGQSWILPLYWLFVVGFVFAGLAAFDMGPLWGFGSLALLCVLSLFFYDIKDKRGLAILAFVGSFGFYFIAIREACLPVNLDYFIAMINPLEGFKNNYEIPTTLGFTCKLVILYISYQFITAVRKDTRR